MRYIRRAMFVLMVFLVGVMNYVLSRPMIDVIQVSAGKALVNRIVVIDPGHGGRDNGAESGDVKEDILNLQVALALKEIIEQAGGTAVMIRDDDFDLSSEDASNRKREDLKRRTEILNQDNVDLFISIHMNKFPQSYVNGATVFYQVNHPLSKQLAESVQSELNRLNRSKKYTKVGNYFILNETQTPGIMVECGFLSNDEERMLLQRSDYQSKLAHAIYDGIIQYLKEAVIV